MTEDEGNPNATPAPPVEQAMTPERAARIREIQERLKRSTARAKAGDRRYYDGRP